MANIMPAATGSHEGTLAWTQVSGTTVTTLVTSTDQAQDGTKSLKVVSAGAGDVVLHAPMFACVAGTTLTTNRYVGFASTGGIFVAEFYDMFESDGVTYITNMTLDNNANANTSAWDSRADSLTVPALTGWARPGIQISFTAGSQTIYEDAWTADDGLAASGTQKHLLSFFPGF